MSSIWHKNMPRYLSTKIYLFQDANSFMRARLEENYELQEIDNVQVQICEHIFTQNGGFCVYSSPNIFQEIDNVQVQICEHIFTQNGGFCVYSSPNIFHCT